MAELNRLHNMVKTVHDKIDHFCVRLGRAVNTLPTPPRVALDGVATGHEAPCEGKRR
jgi:hypothetical protein